MFVTPRPVSRSRVPWMDTAFTTAMGRTPTTSSAATVLCQNLNRNAIPPDARSAGFCAVARPFRSLPGRNGYRREPGTFGARRCDRAPHLSRLMSRDALRRRYARPALLTPSLWRHADFLKLWTGQTVSRLGSVVTRTALPLVALLVLGAGPREMAYLVISASIGVLLVGLVAGAWVDRLRRRPVLVWTDILRAALLFWVPVAYAIGALRIEQLYAVAFLEACLASLFNSAYPAYVPTLIGTDRVVDANSKLATSSSIAEIGGPGLAGTLVQIAGAPFAILVDAFSL